jgi:AcrR family transcriptional regulator
MAVQSLVHSRRLPRQRRRGEILEAARGVFGSRGYHQATTREIASASGVSEALLYQHFDSKREIFEAVIERAAADLEARIARATTGPGDPLAAAMHGYFDFVEEEADLYRVFFHEALQADPAFERLYVEVSQRFLQLVELSLDRLGHGLEAPRAALVAHALTGMVGELGLWWVDQRPTDKERIVQRAASLARAVYMSEVNDGLAGRD